MKSRSSGAVVAVFAALLLTPIPLTAKEHLPQTVTFKGESKFKSVLTKAKRGQWHKLPMGERMIKIARELRGTPYKGFTLEIDNKIESPSVNFYGLDCWTFFELCLGFGRLIDGGNYNVTKSNLLREIEFTRYRGGVCHGNYLDRIHYLAEWFFENEARGVAEDITRELGGAIRMSNRKCCEMTKLWKSYRYLRNNPSLRTPMAKLERKISGLPVYYIPKSKVASIERKLRNGDIVGIVTRYDGGFCSHVGLAYRGSKGEMRLMHASTTYKKVVVDSTVSGYLNKFSKHAGIIVARPLPKSSTVTNPAAYRAKLAKLTK